MRRLMVLAASAAVVLAGTGGASTMPAAPAFGAATPPTLPPYIGQLGDALGLYTNASWQDLASRRPAKEIRRGPGGGPDRSFYIWSRSCRANRQVARFSRRVSLPGPPSPEIARLTMKPRMAFDGAERWEVRFNGSSVYRGRPTPATPVYLDRSALGKLHRGANTIELTATKPAVPCAQFGGVSFGLGAQFVADLYVRQFGSDVRYEELRTNRGMRERGHLTLGNRGPAEAAYATFHLDVAHASSYGEWDFFPEGTGALKNCKKTEDSSNFRVHCEWVGFPPKATGALDFILQFTVTKTPWPDADLVMSYYLTADSDLYRGPKDPNYDDNSRQLRLVLCGPLSTRDGCQSLSRQRW